MQLQFMEFRVDYNVVASFRLPYHCGSLLRGVLGRALRRAGCAVAESSCSDKCAQPGVCAYSRLFDPPVSTPEPYKLLRGATYAPQPLLPLIPHPGGNQLAEGDRLELGLRVLGGLEADDERRVLAALAEVSTFPLGRQEGRLELDNVAVVGERGQVVALDAAVSSYQRAVITFETPVWIEARGRLPTRLGPLALLRAIYRRLCTVAALYGEIDEADEARVSRLEAMAGAVRVVRDSVQALRWERHSLARGRTHPMKGFLGVLEIEGEIGELAGILRLAEVTHVGKATSHGLGRIRVELS